MMKNISTFTSTVCTRFHLKDVVLRGKRSCALMKSTRKGLRQPKLPGTTMEETTKTVENHLAHRQFHLTRSLTTPQ